MNNKTATSSPDTFSPPAGFVPVRSAVEGITVYAPGQEQDTSTAVHTYACPQCGAATRYNVGAGGVACEHCGYTAPVQAEQVGKRADEFEFTLETLQLADHGWGVERQEILCDACGASMLLAEGALTATCPFCASNRVNVRQAPADMLRPRFLVPFQLKTQDVRSKAAEWLGKGWFHPGDLARSVQVERFTGVYLPFWTFDARLLCEWRAEVGRTRTVHDRDGHTRTEIDWSWRTGSVDLYVDDLLVDGTTHVSRRILDRVKPYDLNQLAAYSPDFLAGWNAHAYDVTLPDAWEQGKQEMREQAREACRRDIQATHVRNFSMKADFADETWRYILLPIYLSAYRYGDKTFQVMVNGQNGRTAGQKPVDWTKIWLAIAAMLLPGLSLGLVGLPLLALSGIGLPLVVVGFILFIVGIVLSALLYRKAVESEAA